MSAAILLGRLDGVRHTGPGRWLARCPAHDDRRASLSIRELDDGRVLIHCFAECRTEHVLARVGLEFGDLYPTRPSTARGERLRRPFPAADVLHAVSYEAMVVYLCAQTLDRGERLSMRDRHRLRVAVRRLQHAVEVAFDA
ncbi:MAG: DNA primase [Betaproteobacteria bacterium]|nr:DNA primase [Betaproteobacteria bacterium]